MYCLFINNYTVFRLRRPNLVFLSQIKSLRYVFQRATRINKKFPVIISQRMAKLLCPQRMPNQSTLSFLMRDMGVVKLNNE